MSVNSEDDPAVTALLRWLEEGGAHISKVHAVSLGDGERGLRALDSIAPEESLMRIPSRYVLTLEEARSSGIGRLLDAHAPADEERVYLAAFLLQERERGESSFWKPFLDSLPLLDVAPTVKQLQRAQEAPEAF